MHGSGETGREVEAPVTQDFARGPITAPSLAQPSDVASRRPAPLCLTAPEKSTTPVAAGRMHLRPWPCSQNFRRWLRCQTRSDPRPGSLVKNHGPCASTQVLARECQITEQAAKTYGAPVRKLDHPAVASFSMAVPHWCALGLRIFIARFFSSAKS